MTTKAKPVKGKDPEEDEEDPEESENDEDPKGDGKPDSGGGNLESHIREVVREVVGTLVGSAPAGGKSSPAQDEQSIRKLVRDAQDDLKAEEAREAKLKGLGETVEKLEKTVERPPARAGVGGRVSRFLWGEE